MSRDNPLVSIGLPVFNGENYLKEALDSILAQTYSNFELIISDNASTDGTEEICKAYVAKDRRVSYHRNETNVGAARNFNWTFELSSGKYFKWSAHDDIIAPEFLEKCVEVLEKDPEVVVCSSKARFINETGEFLGDYDIRLHNVASAKPQDRFGDLIMHHHWCFDVFGLIRASALRKTSLIASYIESDRVLLVELGLLGRFHEIQSHLFFPRQHPKRSTEGQLKQRYSRAAWFDPRNEGRLVLPRWRVFFEYIRTVSRMSLTWHEQAGYYVHLGRWLRLYGKSLVKDLLMVTYQILHSLLTPKTKNQNVL